MYVSYTHGTSTGVELPHLGLDPAGYVHQRSRIIEASRSKSALMTQQGAKTSPTM